MPKNSKRAVRPLYRRKPPERGSATRNRWGEATDEPASARQTKTRAAREDARPTNHSALHDTQLALQTVATDAPVEAQPFLKWVGGKGQLLPQLDKFSRPKSIVTLNLS